MAQTLCEDSAMDQCEDGEEGVPAHCRKSIEDVRLLCEPPELRNVQQSAVPRIHKQRPDSPEPSCVSMKSDRSMFIPNDFRDGHHSAKQRIHKQRPDSPEPSCVSMKSDRSMFKPIDFRDGHHSAEQRIHKQRPDSPEPSCVSMKSDRSMFKPIDFRDGPYSAEQSLIEYLLKNQYLHTAVQMGGIPQVPGFLEHTGVVTSWSTKHLNNCCLGIANTHACSLCSGAGSLEDILSCCPKALREGHDQLLKTGAVPICSAIALSKHQKPATQTIHFIKAVETSGRHQRALTGLLAMAHDWQLMVDLGEQLQFPEFITTVNLRPDIVLLSETTRQVVMLELAVPCSSTSVNNTHKSSDNILFQLLEENIVSFVKNELKKIQRVLSPDFPECLESQREDEEVLDGEDEEQRWSSREAFLKITLIFLRRMKQEELADCLHNRTVAVCRRNLQSNHQKKFQCVFEGISKAGNPTLLNQIYTELYITEGGTAEVNVEHEVRQIETASRKQDRPETTIRQEDIFKASPGRDEPIRTVLTKGVAGIGKTVLTQKFTLDWAEDKTNQDIHFIFPFTFRELNGLKERKFSLVELVDHFFPDIKEASIFRFKEFHILFIFDGLDECRLPLDFHNTKILTDVTVSTSVDVLLTNLIRGNLLPSARLWITTRPAAANQIPPGYVDMVTEVRGFTDPQKEEYFRKRFREEEQASRIISHIKTTRSLHIMCHIPVFCWISATVLDLMETKEGGELPKTLTEMYIHFLVVQSKVKNIKYDGGAETDPQWSKRNRKMIKSLGKLAFDQLQKGNLIFYDSDLTDCAIDITAASVYSGVFTQVFREERGLYQDRVFCFVHLSVQEFLAALHVHLTFIKSGVNLMAEEQTTARQPKVFREKPKLKHFYQSAVDKALQSPNGHLDLFLRFLLGLSLETNQRLLRGLLTQTGSSSQTNQKTVQYIKKKISEDLSAERSINLFHCLNELNDHSLVEEIQQSLRSGSLSTDKLSPAQWSALVFILLSSETDLDVFDLKKYSASEEALLSLLPVVKASNKALLSGCNLSERSCEALSSVLSSQSSSLRDLDLSNNDLEDSGVEQLYVGLKSPNCTLETLSLSGCLISEEGCSSLASALSSNPSHLRELDLSYNHPGDSGVNQLSALREDPHYRLETLRVDHGGEQWLTPGLRKYFCQLTLDTNTAHRELKLSENNKKVTRVREDQSYPGHPERFDSFSQLLCRDGLTGRCYWEVEWRGGVNVAVSYRGISREGNSKDCWFGGNDQSWSLTCSDVGYSVRHNNIRTVLSSSSSSSSSWSGRVAVYVDCPAGSLSFYRVSSDSLIHLHTFNTTFTQPLYPGFWFRFYDSSVSLCPL
ncbi:NACHT, LRR and PYD domains-containing protein 6-like [Centropristis striata]|uniref:NACHT, LRR and PYD domains-containing protein 6-like n=1 Tax=Centropristis striata TaxID=184440 RepID=UPI0027DF4111|nr:NACHT, LRR and PYD domains-containing protein 6-like [Centropristis striata]